MGDSVISKMICLHDSLTFLILVPAHRKNSQTCRGILGDVFLKYNDGKMVQFITSVPFLGSCANS